MSNTKRGETLHCNGKGPYYSRYTEHKLILASQPSDPTLSPNRFYVGQPSPVRNCSLDTARQESISSSDTVFSQSRSGSVDRTADGFLEISFDTRYPSSESFLSADRRSNPDIRAASPNLYDRPLSTFRSGSVESCRSVSPHSVTSPDLTAKDKRVSFFEKNEVVNNTAKSNPIHNTKPKGKFSSIISKHAVTIFAAATLKFAHEKIKKKHSLTNSCPELTSPTRLRSSEINRRVKTYSYSEINGLSGNIQTLVRVADNKLRVPDIFTTSFTHSKDTSVPLESNLPGFSISKTGSLKDTTSSSQSSARLKFLRRATSLPKPDDDGQKAEKPTPCKMYKDEQIAQITEYLYIGSIESAYNERRLCRLEVESLVDISNVSEMQVPSHKKTQCPCLCQTEYKHFRSRLIISVADEENDDIDQYFEEVNRFIEGARRCSKKVLIYSYEGKSRAALFAIQYLMSFEGLLLRQAYNQVKKQRPSVTLNPSFQRALENLEKKLFPDQKHSVNICNEYLNVADPQAIKCAWIDC